MRFNIVSDGHRLSGLLSDGDELIVITEGLVADAVNVSMLLEGAHPVVLSLPDDGAVAEGFERLDIDNAAAGLMRIPGSLVERLNDLPQDCDIVSALTRIALQSGAQMRQVPQDQRQPGCWNMVRTESEALAIEKEWLRSRIAAQSLASEVNGSVTLSERVARMGVLSFGSSLLHAGNASGATSMGAVALLVFVLCGVWFGSPVLAFGLIALSWLFVRATDLLRGAERQAYSLTTPAITRADALGWLVDAGLVAICTLAVPSSSAVAPMGGGDHVFAPLMLILTLHLTPRVLSGEIAQWASDRAVLALVLGLGATVGYLELLVKLLAVALIVAGIVLPPKRTN